MPQLTWVFPSALWLLLAVPLVWIAHRAARTNFNARQRRLQAGLRSLLLGAARRRAGAAGDLERARRRQSIVYAVDVSHSIGSPAIEDAARRIDEIKLRSPPRIRASSCSARRRGPWTDTAALRALAKAIRRRRSRMVSIAPAPISKRRSTPRAASWRRPRSADRAVQRRPRDRGRRAGRRRPPGRGAHPRVGRADGGAQARRHVDRIAVDVPARLTAGATLAGVVGDRKPA